LSVAIFSREATRHHFHVADRVQVHAQSGTTVHGVRNAHTVHGVVHLIGATAPDVKLASDVCHTGLQGDHSGHIGDRHVGHVGHLDLFGGSHPVFFHPVLLSRNHDRVEPDPGFIHNGREGRGLVHLNADIIEGVGVKTDEGEFDGVKPGRDVDDDGRAFVVGLATGDGTAALEDGNVYKFYRPAAVVANADSEPAGCGGIEQGHAADQNEQDQCIFTHR